MPLEKDIEGLRKSLRSIEFSTRRIDKEQSRRELKIEEKNNFGFKTWMENFARTGYSNFQTSKKEGDWLLIFQTTNYLFGYKKLFSDQLFKVKLSEKMDFFDYLVPNLAASYNRIFCAGHNFLKVFDFKGNEINSILLEQAMIPNREDPVYYENSLIITGFDNMMHCFDRDGELKWQYDTEVQGRKTPPTMTNDAIYHIKNLAKRLAVAIDYNGKELWTFDKIEKLESSPVIYKRGFQQYIIYGTQDGLIALDKKGRLKWRFQTDKPQEYSKRRPPTLMNEKIFYCMPERNKICCVDARKGKLLWDANVPMNEEEFDYPPSVTEERLFMPGYGKITAYKIQKTGLDKLWDVEVGEGNCTTPAIAYGGYVIMFRHNPTKKSFNMDRKMILVFDKLDEGIEKMEYNISALPITIGVDKHLIE